MVYKQIDCFKLNILFWKFLAIWPEGKPSRYYEYYTRFFITFFVITYDMLLTINFYFLPKKLDMFIEDLLFYFTELAILSKVLTFLFKREKINEIFELLESEIFQPDSEDTLEIVLEAKRIVKKYWQILAVVSYTANLSQILSPLIAHLFLPAKFRLPISNYSFLPENIKVVLFYPLFLYQGIGMHCHMLYYVNIEAFLFGLLILTTAQLQVLDYKLRRVTEYRKVAELEKRNAKNKEHILELELNKCIVYFGAIRKLCKLIENVFSWSLFVQFSMSTCIICVCLFRFTLPAPTSYYVYHSTYITVMVVTIMVTCWCGSRIMETSSALSVAVYTCDWTPRGRPFKRNMRLFVEIMKEPLSITGWKMFPLSLKTFTKIMNTAYSFFTLLRHMQTRES